MSRSQQSHFLPPAFKDEQALQNHLGPPFRRPFFLSGADVAPAVTATATFRRIANPPAPP
jgi:hypothetical protein